MTSCDLKPIFCEYALTNPPRAGDHLWHDKANNWRKTSGYASGQFVYRRLMAPCWPYAKAHHLPLGKA